MESQKYWSRTKAFLHRCGDKPVSKKGLKKQQKEAEKAAKKAQRKAELDAEQKESEKDDVSKHLYGDMKMIQSVEKIGMLKVGWILGREWNVRNSPVSFFKIGKQ